jgi:dipeptidyl aminopeptidase/acylaminoacyl peptidase
MDLPADDYRSDLWLLSTDGVAEPRKLTHGWRDGAPRFSPDGAWVAFTRAERDAAGKVGKPQIWILPVYGGEPRRLTDHPLGAGTPVWSPDSTRLAYLARVPEDGRYGTADGIDPDKEPPRRITGLRYKLDNLGYLGDRPQHVFTIGLDGTEPVQVTSGEVDHGGGPDWSADGELLTFAAARHETADDDLRCDIWVCRPDGSDLRALTEGGYNLGGPRFTPDGRTVICAGMPYGPDRHLVVRSQLVYALPVTGDAAPRLLTDPERHHLANPNGFIEPVEAGVLFANENRGSVEVLLLPYGEGEPTVVLDGPRQVIGIGYAAGTLVASVADPLSWGEVLVLRDGKEQVLTSFNEPGDAIPMTELDAVAADGYPVHGWLVAPEGPGPHPVLLLIHGGPYTQYGWHLFDEAQVYAGAGYAVVMGNPRGSSGYGQAHGEWIRGDVGERSAVDLLALLDKALERPELDASRVGVLGGSHGGFMTSWLAGHHGHRFRAAISERAVNAIDSFTGSSDIGWVFAADMYGPDVERQRAQSPLTYADQIDIPMLIIHSEQDWRCPIEQGQRLYVALKHRGVPVEMLIFPGEGHELSRSGLPSHRVARMEAILDWWSRHL